MDLIAKLAALNPFRDKPMKAPTTIEVVPGVSSGLLSKYIDYEENPDEILAKESRGLKYKLYDEMIWKDPHLKSCTETRFATAASRPWSIVPYDESDESTQVAQFVELMLQRIPLFSECIKRLLGGGVWKGFAVGEIIWEVLENGLVSVKDIKDRHQNRFRFSKQGILQYSVDDMGTKYQDVPPMKFLLLQFSPDAGSNYGTGLARSSYWFYTFKRGAMKQWVISSEKFGAPTVMIRHDEDIDEAVKNRLKAKSNTIMYDASITVSKDVEIELLEAQRRADSPFVPLVNLCNQENSKLILGGTLSNEAGDKGTQALGTVHENVRDDILASDCQLISYVVNSQLVKWIVEFNVGQVAGLPTFVMQYEPPKDRKQIIEVTTGAVNIGLAVDEEYLYEELSIPKPAEGAVLLTPSTPKLPGNVDGNPDGPDPDANADDKLTLSLPIDGALKLLGDFRQNNLASALAAMSTRYASTQASPEAKLPSRPDQLKIKENPERFLPGLPPISKSAEGAAPAVQPEANLTRYQIGAIAVHQSRFRKKLDEIYGRAWRSWLAEFSETPRDIRAVIDDFVEATFKNQLRGVVSNADVEMIRTAAKDIAKKLGMNYNLDVFQMLNQDYLRQYAYDKGVIEGIGETTKRVFAEKFVTALRSGDDVTTMVEFLKAELPQLTEYQTTRIAVTELRQAANWTVLEMGKRSGMDLEAWFITDPLSCPICQDVAAGNPYTIQAAQAINLPHVQCNDYWTMTKRGPL